MSSYDVVCASSTWPSSKASMSASDAGNKIRTAIKHADQAPELFVLARFFIALYYFNICADKYSVGTDE